MKKILYAIFLLAFIFNNGQYQRQPRDYGDAYEFSSTFTSRVMYMDNRLSFIKSDIDYIFRNLKKESITRDLDLIDKYIKAYSKGLYLYTKVYDISDNETFLSFVEWADQFKFLERYRYLN